MTRRRLLLLLVAVSVISMLASGAWMYRLESQPGITRTNASRVKEGMTIAEVERILGGPPRIEGGDGYSMNFSCRPPNLEWMTPDLRVSVWLDLDGRVAACCAYHDEWTDWVEPIRVRLGIEAPAPASVSGPPPLWPGPPP